MHFIDAALFLIWRMIYVTQNNNVFPNIRKNAPFIYMNNNSLLGIDEHLFGSADLHTLNFDQNTFNAKHKNGV